MSRDRDSRVCPECGGDRYKLRWAERDLVRAEQIRQDANRLARENGLLRFERDQAIAESRRIQGLYQQKVIKQARAIVRLEKRLRELGKKPHEDATLESNVGYTEMDAGQTLRGELKPGVPLSGSESFGDR